MNATNRAVNRVLVLVVGLLLVIAGVLGIAVGLLPAFRDAWAPAMSTLARRVATGPIAPGSALTTLDAGVLLLLAIIVAAMVVLLARLGGGRTSTVVRRRESGDEIAVDTAVARDLLGDDLDRTADVVANSVSSRIVRGQEVLVVSVTCRRGASPATVAAGVDAALLRLDETLGVRVPALVRVDGGVRARIARPTTAVR
jgi:hypothetical protein